MPPELAEWLTRLGFGGVFAYMWWIEKARADRERDKNETLSKETVTAMVELKATISAFEKIFTSRGGQ